MVTKHQKNQNRHDSLVELVEQDLIKRGHFNNFHYVTYSRGEIDLYSVVSESKPYVLLFEMKCSKNRASFKKAIDQLNRAEEHYLSKDFRVFKFFVCYDCYEKPRYEWVRNNGKSV